MNDLFNDALYFLAVLNPMSKIFILSSMIERGSAAEVRRISIKSTVVALVILLVFAAAGRFVLQRVFHVELYALRIAAATVLFWMGFKALAKGMFFEVPEKEALENLAIVPLASPMIAGPATMTLALSLSLEKGLRVTTPIVAAALAVNLLIMLATPWLAMGLKRYNLMGALIRITGLIVATIAVQMALTGISGWWLETMGVARDALAAPAAHVP